MKAASLLLGRVLAGIAIVSLVAVLGLLAVVGLAGLVALLLRALLLSLLLLGLLLLLLLGQLLLRRLEGRHHAVVVRLLAGLCLFELLLEAHEPLNLRLDARILASVLLLAVKVGSDKHQGQEACGCKHRGPLLLAAGEPPRPPRPRRSGPDERREQRRRRGGADPPPLSPGDSRAAGASSRRLICARRRLRMPRGHGSVAEPLGRAQHGLGGRGSPLRLHCEERSPNAAASSGCTCDGQAAAAVPHRVQLPPRTSSASFLGGAPRPGRSALARSADHGSVRAPGRRQLGEGGARGGGGTWPSP
mmetsp:Transcript_16691/g.45298  ORF Transcript_16691/g.45298 Transcript_16691/m.45298 type:complete len:304 (+) Transcript_16691:67-978(+)